MESVSGPVELEVATEKSRAVVEHLLQLYIHDLSQYRLTRPGVSGRFDHDDRYDIFFTDPDRCAYLFRDALGPVGFGLLRGLTADRRLMDGFFIVRGVRRHYLGHDAALAMLRRHPGVWEIPFQEDNVGAAAFWRALADAAVGGAWTEDRRPVPSKPHIPDDVWITLDSTSLVAGDH